MVYVIYKLSKYLVFRCCVLMIINSIKNVYYLFYYMSSAKYSEGCILIHRRDPHSRILIRRVSFFEGKVTYTIQNIDSPISETDLDKYYYLSPSNILRTRNIFMKCCY